MIAIIPQPWHVEEGRGHLTLPAVEVGASADLASVAETAAQVLRTQTRTPATATHAAPGDAQPEAVRLELRLDPVAGPDGSASPERYSLVVDADGIRVTAAEPPGLLHGVRSLRQLVVADGAADDGGERPARVPYVVVHDAPRYPWRGLSVDVVRHFYGLEQLRTVVDVLAAYKLNVLHLHLTDDQGWRLESPSRPALTELSSGSEVGGGPGGYLTLDEFDALQEYAARRFVRVVPEIDVPGHVNAATHAYGELVPGGEPTDVYTGIEVGFSRLTYDLPATEPFLRDVFGDLARATRGEFVHIGGDEVLTMDADELARFVELCERVVRDEGKQVVAWQEAAHADVRPGTLIQYWDSHKTDVGPFLRAAEAGARFIMSPGNRAYLDMKYTADHPLGLEWAGLVELRDSYAWDPEDVLPGLAADAIEGVEAAVWTETLTTLDELLSMLLPRLPAVAEVAWTAPGRKDWEGFRRRVATEAGSWRRQGLAFHPTPQVDW